MNYELERHKPTKSQSAAVRRSLPPATQPQLDKSVRSTQPVAAPQNAGGKYSAARIQELLSDGYIIVHPDLWDHLPIGSHVRYFKREADSARVDRFRPGGFVRGHYINKDGKKIILLETRPGGSAGDANYVSFAIYYESIEELWKKYDRGSFIEIHLIYNSLAQKKKQIESLEARVQQLEDILRAVIKQ